MNRTHLDQNTNPKPTVVNTVMNILVPQKAGNFFTIWATISFSRKTLLKEIDRQFVSFLTIRYITYTAEKAPINRPRNKQ